MVTAAVLLFVLGGISVMTTTRESRIEAGARLARYNPIMWPVAVALWAFILWPR